GLVLRMRAAVLGHAAGGLAWGALGVMTLQLTPGNPGNVLTVFFIVAIFATFIAANPSRYEPAYYAWLLCATLPMIAVAGLHADETFHVLAALGALFLAGISIVGRHSNLVMIDSIAKRQENARLLADLLAQKEALAEANRAKTRFFAAASHDLRQPMQAMVLLVESLKERVQESAARRIVESIDSSVTAMSALMNELLDISRFDAGTVKVSKSVFPVARTLGRLRSNFAQAAAQKNLTLRVRACPAVIETDPILLYRVLVNLVNNALRYTREGGVLVAARRRRPGRGLGHGHRHREGRPEGDLPRVPPAREPAARPRAGPGPGACHRRADLPPARAADPGALAPWTRIRVLRERALR
ncbi:MAG TPA: HAMP domain-containing sensor histidine kinase, partial [Usitatibacter sp.]|nr:HAMP domain-containing sensor histidine kinase [Usitatibacter sp.]